MKLCSLCKQTKPQSEFNRNKKHKDGLQYHCRECSNKISNKWAEDNPSADLLKRYGITIEEKWAMIESQGNSCAICKEPFKKTRFTHVDHCHSTGKIRGILCHACNTSLGGFKDSPKLLQRAIHYIDYHAKQNTATPVPKGTHIKSTNDPKHRIIYATRDGEISNDADDHSRTVHWQDANHRTQEGSGDSVAHRNKKVEPLAAFTRLEDNGEPEPEIVRLQFGSGRLFD